MKGMSTSVQSTTDGKSDLSIRSGIELLYFQQQPTTAQAPGWVHFRLAFVSQTSQNPGLSQRSALCPLITPIYGKQKKNCWLRHHKSCQNLVARPSSLPSGLRLSYLARQHRTISYQCHGGISLYQISRYNCWRWTSGFVPGTRSVESEGRLCRA